MTISPDAEYLPQTTDAVDIARVAESPGQMLALAIINKTAPETLSKLMDLHERWAKAKARTAYVVAMTAFKKEAPAVIVKASKVDFSTQRGRTNYTYANLGDIVQQITGMLSRHNLSVSWETGNADPTRGVAVTCHVTHSEGHRESVTLAAPADESGNKNKIQAVGSTVTYLQRYTLMAALGLATTDMDDDGNSAGHHEESPKPASKPVEKPKPQSAATKARSPEEIHQYVMARIADAKNHENVAEGEALLTKIRNWLLTQPIGEAMRKELELAIADADNALSIASTLEGNGPKDMYLEMLDDLIRPCTTVEELDLIAAKWQQNEQDVSAETYQRGVETLDLARGKLQ